MSAENKRVVFHPKGLKFVPVEKHDPSWVRVWPPPENPTEEEKRAANELSEFIETVVRPDLRAAGLE